MPSMTSPLDEVRATADIKADAERRWVKAIYAAADYGYSTREIAEFAGVSHETIRTILKRRAQ